MKVIEKNGDFAYSNVVEIYNSLNIGVSIYPNPTESAFNLEIINPDNTSLSIQITDVLGRVVYSEKNVKSTLNKDVSTWAKGIYVVKIMNATNNSIVMQEKLVVE